MKLFEVSSQSARNRFVSVVGSLIPELHAIKTSLEKMVEDGHGDIVLRHLKSRLARWCSINFPVLISSAGALRHVNPAFEKIASVGISSFTASSGKTSLTKGAAFDSMWPNILAALSAFGSNDLHDRLASSMAACMAVVQSGKQEQQAAKEFSKQKAPRNDMPGKQHDAVEQIINVAIKSLPTELQHQARQAVSKADNKIAALQAFMDKNK